MRRILSGRLSFVQDGIRGLRWFVGGHRIAPGAELYFRWPNGEARGVFSADGLAARIVVARGVAVRLVSGDRVTVFL